MRKRPNDVLSNERPAPALAAQALGGVQDFQMHSHSDDYHQFLMIIMDWRW
jgi:hypothetical protein